VRRTEDDKHLAKQTDRIMKRLKTQAKKGRTKAPRLRNHESKTRRSQKLRQVNAESYD